ncbi:hypothetical protein [Massilia rubra]|uniref:Uncharacterized protein n=1 Tax=Massilia rubra TaxID=2607910 RepID=A0ABX0LUP5_9BURK|nr:hypothetical protein [Massilia rubra]NHZ38232.1 hypothetical protein [Massilia rubra]
MSKLYVSTKMPEQEKTRRLEDELFSARLTIIGLMPERQRQILESYRDCGTRTDTYRWENKIAEELIATAEVIPTYFGDRAYCPLCGRGSSSGYEEGYSLPVGLTRHLTGWGRSHKCGVIAAALAIARGSWDFAFSRAEREQEAEKADLLAERKSSEILYMVDPNGEPGLFDERLHFGGARNTDEMSSAEMRLAELQFRTSTVGRVRSYVDEQEKYVVYADPRVKGRIDFAAYVRPSPKGGRRKFKELGRFQMPDSWKKNLAAKYQNWVKAITTQLK